MTDPLRAAEEALTPVARQAERYEPNEGDDFDRAWDTMLTIGDLRRAASALARIRTARAAVPADREALARRLLAIADSSVRLLTDHETLREAAAALSEKK